MDVILIPGLWLDASAWDDIAPRLREAGHRVHPVTLPGLGEQKANIGMADWIAFVTARIDAIRGPVVLVGHSGGGNVAWAATDARPERVARVVFVDTIPPAPGRGISSEFDVVDGAIPFPGWDFFPDEDVHDLDADTRARTTPLMKSVPARVASDAISLVDARRLSVPVTMLMGSYDQESLEAGVSDWGAYGDEYRAIEDVEVRRIGSGHWPQFTRAERLAELILDAVERADG